MSLPASRANVTPSLNLDGVSCVSYDTELLRAARPHTARASLGRAGATNKSASPYHAPPMDVQNLGLRSKISNTASQQQPQAPATARPTSGRAVYVKVPRPVMAGREYRPLRAKSSYEKSDRYMNVGAGGSQVGLSREGAQRMDPRMKSPASARAFMLSGDALEHPMTADNCCEEIGTVDVRETSLGGPIPGYLSEDDRMAFDDRRGVAIFPSTSSAGFIPPQPVRQEPNPRRRMGSQIVGEGLQSQTESSAQREASKKTALIKELGPAMSAIASLTHETNLGKLVRSINAVTMLLLEADACRVCLYDDTHKILQVLKPGEHAEGSIKENQIRARGVSAIVAGSGGMENVPVLNDHAAFDHECDLGVPSTAQVPKVSYLCAPAKDKGGEIVAVISAIRMGTHSQSFLENDEALMNLISSQAGVAISNSLQREEMQRSKWQHRVLVKAAIELTGNMEIEQGPLCCLAETFARRLTEAESASVCLSYDRNRVLRCWDLVEPVSKSPVAHSNKHANDKGGEVKLQEVSELPIPSILKKVLTTGSICNLLVQNEAQTPAHSDLLPISSEPNAAADVENPSKGRPLGWLIDGKVVTSVFGGDTAGYTGESDSCLAVPLRTHPGAKIRGLIQVKNRCGGPRKVGRYGVFTKQDEEVLRDLGFIVGAALERMDKVGDLERALRLAPDLTSQQSEQNVVEHLKDQVQASMHADRALVFLVGQDGDWELQEPTRKPLHHKKDDKSQVDVLRLPGNAYPLGMAATALTAVNVRTKDVNDRILARKGGLISHAAVMVCCAIRDLEGTVYGVVLVANLKEEHFSRHGKPILRDICIQAGAALRNCLRFQQHEENAKQLQHASLEMLELVKKREMEQIMHHVAKNICTFMLCSRAVLYMVDVANRSIWTIGPDDSLIVTEIKEDADPSIEGSRIGFANVAFQKQDAVVVKDFAYGQHAFNDLLDSADIKHVEKLMKIQALAAHSDQSALLKMKSELEPEERTESIAAILITNSKKEVVAVLQVMNKWKSRRSRKLRKEGFDTYDMDKLALISEAVAFSLENAAVINRRWESETNLREIIESLTNGLTVALGTASRIDIEEALSYVASNTARMCGATQVAVYLLDPQGQLDIIRFEGNLFMAAKRIKVAVAGVAGKVATSGKTVNVGDARKHPSFDSVVDEKQHIPVVSLLCCPIRDPVGQIIGCLAVQNKRQEHATANENTDPFTSHGTHSSRKVALMRGSDHGWAEFSLCDEKVVEAAAQGLGMALTQYQLFDHMSGVSERLKDMSVDLDLQATLKRVRIACAQICRAERCLVWLLDEKTVQMVFRDGVEDSISISADYGLPGAVKSLGGTVFVSSREEMAEIMSASDGERSMANKSRYDDLVMGVSNAIGVAITNDRGRILGVLEVGNKMGVKGFDQTDERVLKVLASHAHVMIQHCRTYTAATEKRAHVEKILWQVVGLVQEVSRSFPSTLAESTVYREIVRAACDLLGAFRGHIYVLLPGDYQHWTAYDDDGKAVRERSSRVAMTVVGTGTLVNNTRIPMFKEQSQEEADDEAGATTKEDEEEDDEEQPTDNKIMCAPIVAIDHAGLKGRTVVGALEVEAQSWHSVWTTEDEEVLKIMAEIAASLLDIMQQIRVPGTKKQGLADNLSTGGSFVGAIASPTPRSAGNITGSPVPLLQTLASSQKLR